MYFLLLNFFVLTPILFQGHLFAEGGLAVQGRTAAAGGELINIIEYPQLWHWKQDNSFEQLVLLEMKRII